MPQLTDIVKNLLIINVIVFALTHWLQVISTSMLAVQYPIGFQPYQIITHMFAHGGTMHLIFNMIALISFGPIVESVLGSKRFFILYLGAGLLSFVLALLIRIIELKTGVVTGQWGMLGASGAIFGVLVAFAMKFPNQKISLIFPPIAMKASYFVLIFIGIDLFLGIGRVNTGIAHFAHLGGALFGFLIMTYWDKFGGSNFNRR